jgi:hypothetical protein
LFVAGLAGIGTGLVVMRTPEPVQLSIGLVAILGVFGSIIWRFGFKGADRLLFARQLRPVAESADDEDVIVPPPLPSSPGKM